MDRPPRIVAGEIADMSLHMIEQRPLTPWRTSTGIVVGGAYIRPAPAPSEDAETIQSMLLATKEPAMKVIPLYAPRPVRVWRLMRRAVAWVRGWV